MWHSLNKLDIKPYLSNSKLLLLSKVESNEVALEDVRPIKILSHLTKIMEKAIKNKAVEIDSKMFETGNYQSGFKQGMST